MRIGIGALNATTAAPAAASCPTGNFGSPNLPLIGCVDLRNPLEIALFGGAAASVMFLPGPWKLIAPLAILILRQELGTLSL